MREEVNAAVVFLAKFMQSKLNKDSLEQFKRTLSERLQSHYANHWFPHKSAKGSGYRCLRINNQVVDPLLRAAANESGIDNFRNLFPDEFTMWIDPNDVAYRIGENGSIGQVYNNVPSKQPLPLSSAYSSYHSTCKGGVHGFLGSPHHSSFMYTTAIAS